MAKSDKILVTYHFVWFTKENKYVGIAHNYDRAVIFSTSPQDSYTDAHVSLEQTAAKRHCELRYFDGEYTCEGHGCQMNPGR